MSLLPDAPSHWQMASLWLWLQLPFSWLWIPFVKTPGPVPGNQCLRVLTSDWGLRSLSCSALHVQLDSWAECCAWMPPAASATGFSAIILAQILTLGILICVNDTNVFCHLLVLASFLPPVMKSPIPGSSLPEVFVTLFLTAAAETQLSLYSSQRHSIHRSSVTSLIPSTSDTVLCCC